MNLENITLQVKWQLIFLLLIMISGCTESEPTKESTLTVEKIEVIEIPFKIIRGGENDLISRINYPYFDNNNQIQWNSDKKNPRICTCMISPVLLRYHKIIGVRVKLIYYLGHRLLLFWSPGFPCCYPSLG